MSINDYKKYCLIDIEIKPVNNKSGKIINIKKEDSKYYHIYFNDNKEKYKEIILIKMKKLTQLKYE